jgi:hypothetical protein
VDSDMDQQVCYLSHTTGVCVTENNINSENRKDETRKDKTQKGNLIKLKKTIQDERMGQSAVKSDPDNIPYSVKYLINLRVRRISA